MDHDDMAALFTSFPTVAEDGARLECFDVTSTGEAETDVLLGRMLARDTLVMARGHDIGETVVEYVLIAAVRAISGGDSRDMVARGFVWELCEQAIGDDHADV